MTQQKTDWRPEGWEEKLREILDSFDVTYLNSDEGKLVEAGASAMLEALKKEPVSWEIVPGKTGVSFTQWTEPETADIRSDEMTIKIMGLPKGRVVFIPEE